MKHYEEAKAIREKYPHIPLQDALVYSDPSTPQYRSFHGGPGGFFGTGFSRTAIAFAHEWHATLWGPARRCSGVNLGVCARLETEDSDVKEAYGAIVRNKHSTIVAWERFARRHPSLAPSWPGTFNMPRGPHAWLASQGLTGILELA